MIEDSAALPYAHLTPEVMLDAAANLGLDVDGRMLALGSYENRVYQFYVTDAVIDNASIVIKFYRPGRWTQEQILEEHAFAQELVEAEIPVVAPLVLQHNTLHQHAGFMYAVYPSKGGRPPETGQPDILERVGRFLGRIHAVGKTKPFASRRALTVSSFGWESAQWLHAHAAIPLDLANSWQTCAKQVLDCCEKIWLSMDGLRILRLHGDCHNGNILWREPSDSDPGGPHFVDLDDACMGPAVQDLWMLLSGTPEMQQQQLAAMLSGYEDFVHSTGGN